MSLNVIVYQYKMEMSVIFWHCSIRATTDFHCELDVNESTRDPCPQNTSCVNKVNGFLCQDYTTFVLVDLRVFGKYIHAIYLLIASFVKWYYNSSMQIAEKTRLKCKLLILSCIVKMDLYNFEKKMIYNFHLHPME